MSITVKAPKNVYRTPYEYFSIVTMVIGIVGLLIFPIPKSLIYITVPIISVVIIKRLWQVRRISLFRRNVKKMPYYGVTPSEIPLSDKALFLGKGFQWTQEHTQRLLIVRLPENHHLTQQSKFYNWVRKHEIKTKGQTWFTKLTSSTSWYNPVKPLPPVGGFPEIHGVEIHEQDIYLHIPERVGHTIVLGTTRVGKTRAAELMINQDIRRGDIVIVFDPKGDADLMLSMYSEAKKLERPFYMFHLGFPDESCRYNPIGDFARVTEVATRIANQLPSDGQSAAFRDFVWRFANVLAKMMEALSIKPSYKNIYACAVNVDNIATQYFEAVLNQKKPDWQKDFANFELSKEDQKTASKTGRSEDAIHRAAYLKSIKINNDDGLIDAVMGILSNERSYFEKLVSSLYPLLEKLTTGKVAELLSPNFENLNDDRPSMDWRKVMASNAVVYVGLDSLTDAEVAAAVGNAMFADLTSLAGQIYKHGHGYGQSSTTAKRRVSIHADEFNELIGDEFIPLLNKAGGAGYQVTAYTQTWADVEARLGSRSKSLQMAGNFNNMIMLRVLTEDTAKMLTERLPEIRVVSGTLVSGASDIASSDSEEDFTSRNEDRISSETVPMLSPSDLTNLPKGQAFAIIEGGHLYKIRFPLPKPDPSIKIPKNIKAMAEEMKDIVRLSQKEEDEEIFMEGKYYGN